MADLSATKSILNWIYSTGFEDIPPHVRRWATLAIYDAIGGILACSLLPVAHRIVDFVKAVGGPPDCNIIGFPFRTSILNAALVNGTLGHADEVDAVEFDLLGRHSIAICGGAALTAGQFARASGQEVIRALVLGRELAKRVDAAAIQAERDTGRTAYGPIDASNTMGAVVTAGIVMGLSLDQMDVALSLGAMMASGIAPSSRESQHMAKSFVKGGVGARNGVAAALMAKVGYDAPRDIFDGRKGFFHSRLGVEKPGSEFLTARDQEFSIGQLVFKRYAAGSPNLAPKQALLELMSEHGLVADDIAEILAEVPTGSHNIMDVSHPTFDGRGMLALAALHGGVGFREVYQEKIYKSPAANAMRKRIKFADRPEWESDELRFQAAITITTKDGRRFQKETDYRRMTEAELDVKFSQLASLRAGAAKATELSHLLKRLDTLSNVSDLMIKLELPAATIDQV